MKREEGRPLPLGVTVGKSSVNFSVAVPDGKECYLLLYRRGTTVPCEKILMTESVGEVFYLSLTDFSVSEYEYNYQIEEKVVIDPYVRALTGRHKWNKECDIQKHEVRGILCHSSYDWGDDRQLNISFDEVIAYSLHVRGFTKHASSKVKNKGTFEGVIEKIPYLLELGINQIHFMPIYEFEEKQRYTNYWGYGEAYCFAPKSAYSSSGNSVTALKDMVKQCHIAGIEVVLEMPFTDTTPKQRIEECLRYYMLEYHIDGFILNPSIAPMDGIYADPFLRNTKIMHHDLGFQTTMRRFLKGDEGMVNEVIFWLRHTSQENRTFNCMAGHSGFTLNDVVSYDSKHNEQNGENNQDGPDYNYSWNCGAEGPSRKKEILQLRENQIRNAFFLLLLAQGTPCILAGDEFCNTQKGNNNVYCQDNAIGWLDWSKQEKEQELIRWVKKLIIIRKSSRLFGRQQSLRSMEQKSCGVPDISYHGESAWKVPSEVSSRQLGIYYSGANVEEEDCYIAYNMHWVEHSFALPALKQGKKWYKVATTGEGILEKPEELKNQRMIALGKRTIVLLRSK